MKTKTKLNLISISLLLVAALACNKPASPENNLTTQTNYTYSEKKENGEWIPDEPTTVQLRALDYLIYNFNQLSRKSSTLKAYNEYGNLLQRNIDALNEASLLEGEAKSQLNALIEKIKLHIPVLQGNNLEACAKSRDAVDEINNEIRKAFNFEF